MNGQPIRTQGSLANGRTVDVGCESPAGGGGANHPDEPGCGFSASSRGAANLGRPVTRGGSFAGRFRLRACAALWSACLPLLLFGCPLFRCRWPSPAGALGVGVGATLLSAAPSLVLLRTYVRLRHSLLLRCPDPPSCTFCGCVRGWSVRCCVVSECGFGRSSMWSLQTNKPGGAQVARKVSAQQAGRNRETRGRETAVQPRQQGGVAWRSWLPPRAFVVLLSVTGVTSKQCRTQRRFREDSGVLAFFCEEPESPESSSSPRIFRSGLYVPHSQWG